MIIRQDSSRLKVSVRPSAPPVRRTAAALAAPLLLLSLSGFAPGSGPVAAAAAQASAAEPPGRVVEIAVRVLDAGAFAAELDRSDFEILDAGVARPLESLVLVRNGTVERREPAAAPIPDVSRHFYVLCQTMDWDPALGGIMDHLFGSVLRPGDSLTLLTPFKAYTMAGEALARRPAAALAKEMQGILRKDIQTAGGDYRSLLRNLRRLVQEIGGGGRAFGENMESDSTTSMFGLETKIESYKQALVKLDGLRILDERKVLAFAEALRRQSGRRVVFLFYQREFRPEISPTVLNTMMSMYQDQPNILSDLNDLFQFYRREPTVDAGRIRAAFADTGAVLHLFFMNKESESVFGATMREQSEDILPVFRQAAEATGGIVDTSQNPAAEFRRAAAGAEDYYILSFTPPAGPAGTYRAIEIRVPGRAVKVSGPAGYYVR